MLTFSAKFVAAASTMAFWLPNVSPAVWIGSFLFPPILFNMFNVRRYGEIEFWLATVKATAVVLAVVLGILLPLGVSTYPLLLGTSPEHKLIPCNDPAANNCIPPPGFNCASHDIQQN